MKNSKLSDFIRKASPAEKEKVYAEVIKGAIERQLAALKARAGN